jgi:hypothetical protein
MSERVRCGCGRCMVGGMRWPVVLITIGVLFMLDRMEMSYRFHDFWPVILIVIGVMKVAESLAPGTGHVGA